MSVAEAGRILNADRKDLVGARRLYAVPALGYSARRRLATRLENGVSDLGGLHVERLFQPEAE